MSTGKSLQSALFIGNGDDDVSVLVVGGLGANENEADLLTNRPHQRRGEQGRGDSAWRWQQLSPMLEKRWCRPGMLLLGRERVLVAGGGGNNTAEILQLPSDENDIGVWTLLTQPLTREYTTTFLVNFDNRIVAVGMLRIKVLTVNFKLRLSVIDYFHFRR